MTPRNIHMVGIGGIGMSALAQYYRSQGALVTGSDRDESPTTHMLRNREIVIQIGRGVVPQETELLVYSDAVPDENPERVEAQALGIVQMSYFAALGKVAEDKRVVAVAGTHGKTTTTAMIAKILIDAQKMPTVIVGSIVSAWGSNFYAGHGDLFVVEACEYRNHFFTFKPEVLVITNTEWDHTDFFKDLDEVKAAFAQAAQSAQKVVGKEQYEKESAPELLVPGEFNRENARAAKAAVKALNLGVTEEQMDTSLAGFTGTWRRFEYKGVLEGGAQLYDDYAHHPTAIEKTIEAAKQKFVGKKIVVFFHPHLYSRTRDLWQDFKHALSKADQIFILPVYAAREPFDGSVSHEALAKAIPNAQAVSGPKEATTILQTLGPDTVAFTMGAGDVYKAGEAALRQAQGTHK